MDKIKNLVKRAFSTSDNIEEMSFLEIVIDSIIGGFVISITIGLLKVLLLIFGLIGLFIIMSVLF